MILFGCLLMTGISVAAVFAPNIYIFIVIRFVQGVLSCCLWQIPFVVGTMFHRSYLSSDIATYQICSGVEITGPSRRTLTGMVIELFFTAGMIILGGMAYFIRNWQHLQLAIALPGVVFLTYYWQDQ